MPEYEIPLSVSEYLDDQLQLANHQIANWTRVRGFLLTIIDQTQGEIFQPIHSQPPHRTPATRHEDTLDSDISTLKVDFTGTKNNAERLFLIAEEAHRLGKVLSTTQLAQFFIDNELTTANLHSGKTIVSQIISDFGDHFKRIKPGLYRYTPGDNSITMTDDPSGDELSVIQ